MREKSGWAKQQQQQRSCGVLLRGETAAAPQHRRQRGFLRPARRGRRGRKQPFASFSRGRRRRAQRPALPSLRPGSPARSSPQGRRSGPAASGGCGGTGHCGGARRGAAPPQRCRQPAARSARSGEAARRGCAPEAAGGESRARRRRRGPAHGRWRQPGPAWRRHLASYTPRPHPSRPVELNPDWSFPPAEYANKCPAPRCDWLPSAATAHALRAEPLACGGGSAAIGAARPKPRPPGRGGRGPGVAARWAGGRGESA